MKKTETLRKLTILHSNDLHGDFIAKSHNGVKVGGMSLLSGYIQKVRAEERYVLYTVSGDMLRGSVIDSEYMGLSTIEIMNMLAPDVATLGNHEVDYGLAHLLFLEKCARFPIVNANMYIKTNQSRLFKSHHVMTVGNLKILFIGILTEEVLAQARKERLVGSFVDIHEAASEVGKICNNYQTEDVDLTVLLTHIGIEEDKQLAAILDPNWGVDVIIGGHSHTYMTEPVVVNGIPIVQAATGSGQLGRFDMLVDKENNCIHEYTWQLVEINENTSPRDTALEDLVLRLKTKTDEKYGRYITRFAQAITHPRRDRESEAGRLFADIFRDSLELDVMFMASGSIRLKEWGPMIQYRDLQNMFPYNDEIYRVVVNGEKLEEMIRYLHREQSFSGEHVEHYQYSRGLRVVVNAKNKNVEEILFEGKAIDKERLFNIGIQNYHYINKQDFFNLSDAEAKRYRLPRIVATASMDIVDEWMSSRDIIVLPNDKRWITIEE